MPTVLESAKDASYTALGLNVLFLDEMNERLAGPREQVAEQLDIARKHAKKARAGWQKQADGFGTTVKDRLPFDLAQVGESVQSRVQPVARRTWDAAEPAMNRFTELTPAPFDGYMKVSVTKLRYFLVTEPEAEAESASTADVKTAEASKTEADKTTAKKTAAPKSTAKKADTKG